MRGRPTSLALALALATAGCSLLAPSDSELMDGGKGGGADGGGADASADASDSGADGDDGGVAEAGEGGGGCGNLNDLCGTGPCCAGLSCQLGTCLPCRGPGTTCTPSTALDCCSGICSGHVCQ